MNLWTGIYTREEVASLLRGLLGHCDVKRRGAFLPLGMYTTVLILRYLTRIIAINVSAEVDQKRANVHLHQRAF